MGGISMCILVTGGAGYIGSHTAVALLESGYRIAVIDNLSNAKLSAIEAVRSITGKDFPFYQADILDESALDRVFSENRIQAAIHFAALKAVGESTRHPLEYYHNNVGGTVSLCRAMTAHGASAGEFLLRHRLRRRKSGPLPGRPAPQGHQSLRADENRLRKPARGSLPLGRALALREP
jgi:dTDP-D-glucose 4,6-dehydratase